MSLSCSCDWEYDAEPGQWSYLYYEKDIDFKPLETHKRKRCVSCKKLINIGDLCVSYPRYRYPYNDIEAEIVSNGWGNIDEPNIRIADHHHCERCGEIFLNIVSIGYECLMPNENMEDALKEYHLISGFLKAS